MFEKMFGKREQASSAPDAERVTRPLDVESIGVKEKPFRGGGEKAEVLKLPEGVFVGSEGEKREAELLTEFPDVNGEIVAKRSFSYVQTPDGRVHSNRAVFERMKTREGEMEKRIVEERKISPEGQVRSSKRTVEMVNGEVREGVERLAYDADGNVSAREYTLSINGEEVFRSETTPDPKNPENTVSKVVFDKRPGREGEAGKEHESVGGAKRFRNAFDSENSHLLER